MSDSRFPEARLVSRITVHLPRRLTTRLTQRLSNMGMDNVLLESGRTVRRVVARRPFGLPGTVDRLEDSVVDVLHMTVPPDAEQPVLQELARTAELDVPGYGSIYAQRVEEYGCNDMPEPNVQENGAKPRRRFLSDLALIAGIVSMSEATSRLVETALELGSSVPVITLGAGTGVRDQLGLLRVTIPPEKEILQLLVPQYDATEIMRLLVEEGRLDRPGRGFMYRTPVTAGMLDTRLRVGPSEHAASMEQVIAAIDEIRRGTWWRKRFSAEESSSRSSAGPLNLGNTEITLICSEGRADSLVKVALNAGAGGATTTRLHRLHTGTVEGGAARERSILSVPADLARAVVEAVLDADAIGDDPCNRIQVLAAPAGSGS